MKKMTESVPKNLQARYQEVVKLSDDFAAQHLNDEYAQVIRYAVAALCRKRPSPVEKGKAATWACGATHAIGMVNFLFDKSQVPHISASDLYKGFGVGESTGQGKSKLIRDLLKMSQLDPHWTLPNRLESNPMVWMISVNGMLMDVRNAPMEVQEIALSKGLIPYIPGQQEGS